MLYFPDLGCFGFGCLDASFSNFDDDVSKFDDAFLSFGWFVF